MHPAPSATVSHERRLLRACSLSSLGPVDTKGYLALHGGYEQTLRLQAGNRLVNTRCRKCSSAAHLGNHLSSFVRTGGPVFDHLQPGQCSPPVLEHQVSLGAGYSRIGRQMFQDKLADVLGVPRGDVDQEVVCTSEDEELLDLGQVP